jgi:hypothetical protein
MTADISHIIVIESLDNERRTGTELYNDSIKRYIEFHNSKMTHNLHIVNSKLELIEILNYYVCNSLYMPGGLLIHFEMHGAEDRSGLVLSDGSLITWVELVELFRKININTTNNLHLSLATCYGRYLYKGVDFKMKSPYSSYISSSTTAKPIEIIEQFSILFDNLISNGNLVKAYLDMEQLGTKFYYKDSETTFEVGFRNMALKSRNDPAIRKSLISAIEAECKLQGLKMPPDNQIDLMNENAIKNTYEIAKKTFHFP